MAWRYRARSFFRMSRSIRSVRFSRRSCPSSSRSAVVSAPGVPRPASISACRTQLRSAVSVRSSSRATVGTDLPLSRTSRTASALNSLVNARRFRLAMTHSYRTFVRSGVSTKPGQVHCELVPPEPDYAAHDEGNVARCPQAAREDPPRGLVLMTPSRRRPDPEPTLTIFPDQLHLGDRFAEADVGDEERVWEVVSRPVTYKQGHEVRARVQRPGEPRTAREHAWPAHQKISVRRNATAASRPLTRPASDAGAAYDIEALRQGAPAA